MTPDGEPLRISDDAAILPSRSVAGRWSAEPVVLDPRVREAGDAHLARTLETWPSFYDGPVGCMRRLARNGATLAVGGFFDVLRTDGTALDPAGRDLLSALAGGDELLDGTGRAAALGVSVLLLRGEGPRRRVLAGLRSAEVVNPGLWHTVPAGTLDAGSADTGEEPVRATAAIEAREELGLEIDVGDLMPLGWAWDLPTLRPEAVLAVRADDLEVAGHCAEHDELAWLPLAAPPPEATPILRAALALAELGT